MNKFKNIAGEVLTYKSKNFHWLNKKLDPERTVNGLEKSFGKNVKKSKVSCRMWTKTTSEKANFCSKTVFLLYFKIRAKKFSRRRVTRLFAALSVSAWPKSLLQFHFKNHVNVWTDLKKNIAGRIPEKTRRRKLILLMTKQLEQLLWSLNLHNSQNKFKEE